MTDVGKQWVPVRVYYSSDGKISFRTDPSLPVLRSWLDRQIYMDITEGGWGMFLDELVDLYGRKAYRAVRRMEKRGIITRVPDPENPRRTIICTKDVHIWLGEEQ